MPRKRAWNGEPPRTAAEARRRLLDAAQAVVERVGLAKAGLSDVADAAGVTRQTVYRYFDNADDLFHSSAAFASGGFHERLRRRALACNTLAERMVECLVFAIVELPRDPHLGPLVGSDNYFTVANALELGFVQEEIVALADGDPPLDAAARDELAELLLRLLHSFLVDPGLDRDEETLRAFLRTALVPAIDARIAGVE